MYESTSSLISCFNCFVFNINNILKVGASDLVKSQVYICITKIAAALYNWAILTQRVWCQGLPVSPIAESGNRPFEISAESILHKHSVEWTYCYRAILAAARSREKKDIFMEGFKEGTDTLVLSSFLAADRLFIHASVSAHCSSRTHSCSPCTRSCHLKPQRPGPWEIRIEVKEGKNVRKNLADNRVSNFYTLKKAHF